MIKHSENKKHNKTPMTKKKYAQCLHTDKILTIDSSAVCKGIKTVLLHLSSQSLNT